MAEARGKRVMMGLLAPLLRARAALFSPGHAVLPLYQPQRSGLAVVARRTALLVGVLLLAVIYGLAIAVLPPSFMVAAAAPLAVAALMVIWALPEAPSAPLRLLIRCYVAFMVLGILWPNYLSVAVGGLPWISIRRLLGLVTSGVLLTCYSTSRDFRREIADILRASPLLSRFMLGFLTIQAISAFTSVSPGDTIGRLVNLSITVTPFFFMTMWIIGTGRRTAGWWLRLMLTCMLLLMVLGLFEFRAEHILWVNHIPSFLKINDESIQGIFVPQYRDHYRVVTVFSHPLVWGEIIALMIPFAIHLVANSRSVAALAVFGLLDLVMAVSAYLSGARLSMVGLVVAHAVYLLLWGLRRWRKDRGGLIGITTTMLYPAFLVALFGAIMFVPAIHNRVLGGGATQASNNGRTEQMKLGIPAIAKRPLFGYGPGQGGRAVGWRTLKGQLTIDSGFLSTGADYGVLGFLAFFGTIVLSIVQLAKRGIDEDSPGVPLHLALAASLTVLITTRLVLSKTENDQVVFMLLGLAFALLYRSSRKSAGAATAA